MTFEKLKVAARQHEQREEWREAIELYRQAVREADGGSDGGDPTTYNRIGDLEHRLGDHRGACEAWEQAATRYAEHGLTNNAIALCTKILRLEPSRIRTYLDLATFQARKQMLFDVRANLAAYRDRMHTVGEEEACRQALERFGETFSGWPDVRKVVDELLGREQEPDEAQPGKERRADRGPGLVFIDTEPAAAPPSDTSSSAGSPLTVEQTTSLADGATLNTDTLDGLMPTVSTVDDEPGRVAVVEGLVDVERTAAEVGETIHLEGFDPGIVDLGGSDASATIQLDGLETREFVPPSEPIPALPSATDQVVFIDLGPSAETATPDATPPPAPADPNDPVGQRVTALALLERGDRAGGIAGLERAMLLYSEREEWLHAWQVAGELTHAEPQTIDRHQARVELAARMQDTVRLCDSYQALGDALVRAGSEEKAIAVYRRLLELNEGHAGARAALRAMLPEAPETVSDGFIDFGAMVIDDAGPRSTRMRTETTAISADEDETFREALAEFKRALDQNVPVEDHQAHYDLGIAFKEMGLLDEAVNAFQKALRSTVGRLRTAEALGATFLEKGMPPVAEAVLRSVERGPEDDAEKIGVLYWLGRALESQGKAEAARSFYERVLAVEVGFMDATDRIVRIASESSA